MVTQSDIWNWLEEVSDPEVPVLSVVDLGVIREIKLFAEKVHVVITPTYSGCPAMKVIEEDIISKLNEKGIKNVEVSLTLSPAWTTDWLSENGRLKLKAYGIAPPADEVDKSVLFAEPPVIACPLCNSKIREWFPNLEARLAKLIINARIA